MPWDIAFRSILDSDCGLLVARAEGRSGACRSYAKDALQVSVRALNALRLSLRISEFLQVWSCVSERKRSYCWSRPKEAHPAPWLQRMRKCLAISIQFNGELTRFSDKDHSEITRRPSSLLLRQGPHCIARSDVLGVLRKMSL
jgi:hypothetical protein